MLFHKFTMVNKKQQENPLNPIFIRNQPFNRHKLAIMKFSVKG